MPGCCNKTSKGMNDYLDQADSVREQADKSKVYRSSLLDIYSSYKAAFG